MSKHFFTSPIGSFFLAYRRPLVWFSQVISIVLAYLLAFMVGNNFTVDQETWPIFWWTLPVVLVVKVLCFRFFDLHRGWWRYVGMEDLQDILKAANLSFIILFAVWLAAFRSGMPLSILLVDWMSTILLIGGIRFAIRSFREGRGIRNTGSFRNVLIFGAREIGVSICKEMRNNLDLRLNPVGFIDDFLPKKGFKIHGVPILGDRSDVPRILERYNVDEIIIAQPGIPGRVLREFISQLKTFPVRLKMVPPMSDLLAESVSIRHLRQVDLADLLGRESVELDTEAIGQDIGGRTVLITGAGGSIGSELARQVASFDPQQLILFERNENNLFYIHLELVTKHPELRVVPVIGDILDREHLLRLMKEYRPSLIYHAAAYKHVPMMEANPILAVRNNVFGSRCVVEAAAECGVEKFVLISTDKAVRPMNVMGMTKRVTELQALGLTHSGNTRFMVVRFGNVLGSNGSVIQLFRKQIDEGGPVTVTHSEAMRYFMTIPEAVQLVMQAGTMGQGDEIFVLEMGRQIKILDLALNLIRLSGFEPEKDIEIRFTGLRPGEKMAEELFTEEEGISPTAHPKIRSVRCLISDEDKLNRSLEELEELVKRHDAQGAIRKLWEICYGDALEIRPGISLNELMAQWEKKPGIEQAAASVVPG